MVYLDTICKGNAGGYWMNLSESLLRSQNACHVITMFVRMWRCEEMNVTFISLNQIIIRWSCNGVFSDPRSIQFPWCDAWLRFCARSLKKVHMTRDLDAQNTCGLYNHSKAVQQSVCTFCSYSWSLWWAASRCPKTLCSIDKPFFFWRSPCASFQ